MTSTIPFRGRRRTRIALTASTIAVLTTVLAACGSSSGSTASSTSSTSTAPTPSATSAAPSSMASSSSMASGGSSSVSSSAQAGSGSGSSTTSGTAGGLAGQVAALEKPLAAYPVPTDPISNVSSLSGKTIYYIPITQQSPQFAVTEKALTTALATVKINLQICDGKGTPTDVSSCITQATQAKAATIVTDAIPYVIATNSLNAAQAAGIPVIISNQVADPAHPASKTLATIPAGGSAMEEALAKWITLDSAGKADVLLNQSTDGPAPAAYVAAGKAVYAQDCAACKLTVNTISSANFSLIPSSTSAAMLKDPNLTYVESQFEQYLQATQSGVQSAGKTNSVKVVTGAAQLGGLQALASGNGLYAAAAQASAYQGWVDADAAMRLMLGTSVPNYTIPVRLFTRDSIKSVTVTADAQASGEWFGPATFTADFKKLWGVA